MTRRIAVTGGIYELRHPWEDDCFVQGGKAGVVIVRDGDNYRTAFIEAFPSETFIRGEGRTLEEAEDSAWEQHLRYGACLEHEWAPYRPGFPEHPYTNGGGFCQRCGRFESNRFTGEQLGQFCAVCGVGTTWATYGPQVMLVPDSFMGIKDDSPEDTKVWYCRPHSPFRSELDEMRERWDSEEAT